MPDEPHPFVSSSLFVDITTITVDPGYVEAAARRAADPAAGPSRTASVLVVSALVAAGAVCGVAAAQTRSRAPAAARVRASLVAEAKRRTAATDALARQREALRRETDAARTAALARSGNGRTLSAELDLLELDVGGTPVRGPGLVVTLDDGVPDDDGAGRISDIDLQALVNALWASGAEAIAVNDRRISGLSAIRKAGEAILIDYRPVTAPYVVRAVGDPDAMEPAFGDTATARRFRTWVDAFGLQFEVERAKRLDLPASETSRLRHATPAKGTS